MHDETQELEDPSQSSFLKDYIKYCLAYLRIQNATVRPKDFLSLGDDYFELVELLKLSPEEEVGKVIDLPILHKYTPENVPEEEREQYGQEKSIAQLYEQLISAQKNEEYTKEIILRFGKFAFKASPQIAQQKGFLGGKRRVESEESTAEEVEYTHWLFYVRATIQHWKNGYVITPADGKIFYDLTLFENVFENNDIYYEALKKFGESEREDKLTLPTDIQSLQDLSDTLLSKLRLSDIIFSQDKVDFSETAFSITNKVNYFLTKDLDDLSGDEKIDIEDTSLSSWDTAADVDLNNSDEEVIKSGYLFFPFQYNKSQLQVLKLLPNKAFIVEGPPGTGKSQTITNLLCHLAAQDKKVLFVSQKQQALKVVKERLSTLNIDNLFGYMTSDSTEQQDYDTFSNSLERLKIMGDRQIKKVDADDIPPVLKLINEKAVLFNEGLKHQQRFFDLYETLKDYPDHYFALDNPEVLSGVFSYEKLKEYNELLGQVATLKEKQEAYECGSGKELKSFEEKFSTVLPESWQRMLSSHLEEMIQEMKHHNFENQPFIKGFLIKRQLEKAHRDNIQSLPREISSYLDGYRVSNKKSLGERVKAMESVREYCIYQEAIFASEEALNTANKIIAEANLTQETAGKILELIFAADNHKKEFERFVKYNAIYGELREINPIDYPKIAQEVTSFEERRQRLVQGYLHNLMRIRSGAYNTLAATMKGKIVSFAKGIRKSKKAFKTFEKLRNDSVMFEGVSDIVPIWIMSLEDASRVLPLEAGLFDYLVIDEASQCNIAYALPAMYRAKKTIIVGDLKQMRDDTMLFKRKSLLEDIAVRYGIDEDRRIVGRFDNVKSILDIGLLRGFRSQLLEEHYRSPNELIGFSNEHFYNNQLKVVNHNYLTYKDTNRVLINHKVEYVDTGEDTSPRVNVCEANKAVELIREFKSDPLYKDQTIAVLTFFNDQANLIRKKVDEVFGFGHDIKISIIEGIQGDERDIVIYSLVIRDPSQKRQYGPLTGEGGEIRPELAAGRINVAFSRAKKQVHCISCLGYKEWPSGIWIDKYLAYIEENGEVESAKLELRPFGSYFEKEFYDLAFNRLKSHLVYNQVPSCGYYIDFVVHNKKNGKKLAIECDGPHIGHHFKDEASTEYTDSDIKRQLVLESAGWQFYRIKYSDWVDPNFNRENTIKEVELALE